MGFIRQVLVGDQKADHVGKDIFYLAMMNMLQIANQGDNSIHQPDGPTFFRQININTR